MRKEIQEFLVSHRVCVVAVEMPDGAPHAATVHFAHTEEPLTFIVQTNPNYRKAEPLLQKKAVRVSLVVGTEEMPDGKDKTFQLDGTATLVDADSTYAQTYLNRFPEKQGKWLDDIFFVIEPTWWRYTDWGRPEGKTVFNSDGTISVKGVLLNQ